MPVISKQKPEYVRLSYDSLLERCLQWKTQNQNDALNGGSAPPKEVYVDREMGLYDAVAYSNMDTSAAKF